jgi:type VI protein secretion system component VasA
MGVVEPLRRTSVTMPFGVQHLEPRLAIGREVRTEPYEPGLTQLAAHREAKQHAGLGVFDDDIERFQARLVLEQGRFDRSPEFVRRRGQMAIDFRQIVESVVGQMREPVATGVQDTLDVVLHRHESLRGEIEVVLAKPYPDDMRFSAENVRLFRTPIINLFQLEADPIVAIQFETDYRVHASQQHGDHVDVYSVDTIQGLEAGSGRRFEYAPFASFRHRGGMLRHERPERYFHTRVRRGPSGRFDTWVVLGDHAWEHQATLPKETLSLTVTGTNGMLPRKALREAGITCMRSGFTNIGAVRNLTAPTPPVYPPTGDLFQWRVLSHLAPNYLSLLNAEILRGSLALYDWTEGELNKRRIDAITDVQHRLLQKRVKGGLQRGVGIEVTLDSNPFAGDGDVERFGGMLNRFLGLYATLNLFTTAAQADAAPMIRVQLGEWTGGSMRDTATQHFIQ